MELIINFDEQDNTKRDWLLRTLKLMGIKYKTKGEGAQTLEEYNADLETGNSEIEQGKFTTAEQLKNEIKKW
jgi:hypothetical protein